MSNPNSPIIIPVEQPFHKKHLPWWLCLITLLSIVLVAAFLIFVLAFKPAVDFVTEPEVTDGLPQIVNSYFGTITALGSDYFLLQAEADNNYLRKDAAIAVKVVKETVLTALVIPQTIKTDVPLADQFAKKPAKFSDLKVGQKVTVFSAANIKNVNEMTADSVEIQSVK